MELTFAELMADKDGMSRLVQAREAGPVTVTGADKARLRDHLIMEHQAMRPLWPIQASANLADHLLSRIAFRDPE